MSGWLILLALAVLAATAYLTSLQCRPWTSCKGCSRSGKTRDPAFRSTSGTCRASAAWPRARARCPRLAAPPGQADDRRPGKSQDHRRTEELMDARTTY